MAARLRQEKEDEERERDERRRAALRVQESQKKLMEDARRAPGDNKWVSSYHPLIATFLTDL